MRFIGCSSVLLSRLRSEFPGRGAAECADKADPSGNSALDGYLGYSDWPAGEVETISRQNRYGRYIRQSLPGRTPRASPPEMGG